jgi:hypothetical protein
MSLPSVLGPDETLEIEGGGAGMTGALLCPDWSESFSGVAGRIVRWSDSCFGALATRSPSSSR